LALLGKWCWPQLSESHSLLFRLLAAKYGIQGAWLHVNGTKGSVWWRAITNIRDGVGSVLGTWFPDNLCLKVENGSNTLFWFDRW